MSLVTPRCVWQITREYAGLAEAGGVKNVVCSLSEVLASKGIKVSVVIPFYGFMKSLNALNDIRYLFSGEIESGGEKYKTGFYKKIINSVEIILVDSEVFSEKNGVYTYTEEDELQNPENTRGTGFKDEALVDVIHQKAVVLYKNLSGERPDIIQCHDGCTAFIPALFHYDKNPGEEKCSFIVTIHNAGPGYLHTVKGVEKATVLTGLPEEVIKKGSVKDVVYPYLVSIPYCNFSTVSPWYGKELRKRHNPYSREISKFFFKKHVAVTGILNGLDYSRYVPGNKEISLLPFSFSPQNSDFDGKYKCRDYLLNLISSPERDSLIPSGIKCFGSMEKSQDSVYFVYHGRIAYQKGLDNLIKIVPGVVRKNAGARFIIVGQGDSTLENENIKLAEKFPGKFVYFKGYERGFVRLVLAAGDFLILPSRFEPCGLEDLIGKIYGTIPIASASGGLNKIKDGKSGFLVKNYKSWRSFAGKMLSCAKWMKGNPEDVKKMMKYSSIEVFEEYSWNTIVTDCYLPYYSEILKKRGETSVSDLHKTYR